MTFREWLPITGRNRGALCLAGLSLVMFAVWNFLPFYEGEEGVPTGTMASVFWVITFSPDIYLSAIRTPGIWNFLAVAACLATLSGGLVILLTIPLWKMLHASSYLRLPIAWLNLAGGVAWCWYAIVFFSGVDPPDPYLGATAFLMSLSLFSISTSFFLFQNELMLRKERNHAAAFGKGRSSH